MIYYYATVDINHVTLRGHEALVVVPKAVVVAFGTNFELVKMMADNYARENDLLVHDNVQHRSYSPV